MATRLKRVTTDWNETITYEVTVEQNNGKDESFGNEDILINSLSLDVGVPLNEFLAIHSAMTDFIKLNRLKML